MSQRTLTSRDMLRYQSCEQLLGCNQLTPEVRYEQARTAQKLRNFFTTATLQARNVAGFVPPTGVRLLARTPAFSDSLVITDLITLYDRGLATSIPFAQVEVFEYGGPEHSYGIDFFGLSGRVPQRYIIRHEKNYGAQNGPATGDLQGRYVGFVPRLLAPYQQLEFDWLSLVGGATLTTSTLFLQTGVRAVRCLQPDNPYSYFTVSTDREIQNYIDSSRPETFFLEATLALADFPATNATVAFKTPQMERPLLVLGATCNVEGCQAELRDESKYYTFTAADDPLTKLPSIPLYKSVPLSLWAAINDFRNTNLYDMWAVPHLLERGSQFVIKLTSGLNPQANGNFRSTILTRSEQPVRITFICRTV